MGMNLILTRYTKLDELKYCEEKCKNLEVVELTNDMYENLICDSVSELDICEDAGDTFYSQKIVLNEKISKLIKRCTETSLSIIDKINNDNISDKEKAENLDELRVVLNVRNLLKEKNTKYANQDEIFIIVG